LFIVFLVDGVTEAFFDGGKYVQLPFVGAVRLDGELVGLYGASM